jgi:hypothetical protein
MVLFNSHLFQLANAFIRLAKATSMPVRKVVGGYMKKELLTLVKTVFAPVTLVLAMAAFSPASALAAGHEGGRGFTGGRGEYSEGHSFAAPSRRDFSGRGFSAPARGFNGGVRAGGGYYAGRGYYRAGGYYDGRGFGFGVYVPYGYSAPVCNPSGFYDQNGMWHVYSGCAVPYGY